MASQPAAFRKPSAKSVFTSRRDRTQTWIPSAGIALVSVQDHSGQDSEAALRYL